MSNVPQHYDAIADVFDRAEEPRLPKVTLEGQRFNRNTREREDFTMTLPDPDASRFSINGAQDRLDTIAEVLNYAIATKLTKVTVTDHSATYPTLEILLALR